MTVPAEEFTGGPDISIDPVDVRVVENLIYDERISADWGVGSTMAVPLVGTAIPVQILQRRVARDQAHIRNSDTVNSIMFAERQDKLQALVPNGFILTPGQIQRIENQQPFYAVALTNNPQSSFFSTGLGVVAAGAGSAALPAGASFTGFVITNSVVPTANATVTVSNVAGGNLVFNMPTGATGLTIALPSPLAASGGPVTVTVAGPATLAGNIIAEGSIGLLSPVQVSVLDEAFAIEDVTRRDRDYDRTN